MSTGFLPSTTVRDFFGSEEMSAIFADASQMQAWLDVEAALARAQARLGIVPETAAAEITAAARVDLLDAGGIAAQAARTGHPLVPLIRALVERSGSSGAFVHLGATTQDVMDTGYVLRSREALALVDRQITVLARLIAAHARTHRDTVMAGRTHGQQALPTTFGLRLVVWLDELERHRERIAQLRTRLLVGSFGGAAGTMAGYGPDALRLRDEVMSELGLGTSNASWHASQDRFAECIGVLGLIASTGEKLAREIYLLGRTEIGEVAEAQDAAQVGSSTMPHKRNPIRSESVIAAAMTLRSQVPLAMAAMVAQDDRDMGSGIVLWKLLPEAFILAGGILQRLGEVFAGLVVDPATMAANLDRTGGLLASEAVMLRLAPDLGREEAHHRVSLAAKLSHIEGSSFRDCLLADPALRSAITADELDAMLDPRRYVGKAAEMVDAVLARHGYPPA